MIDCVILLLILLFHNYYSAVNAEYIREFQPVVAVSKNMYLSSFIKIRRMKKIIPIVGTALRRERATETTPKSAEMINRISKKRRTGSLFALSTATDFRMPRTAERLSATIE